MTDLHWLSIAEVADMIRRREISSVELTQATLDRITATEPLVHAYAGVMAETALEDATRADAEIAAGRDRGPLQGSPSA